MFEVPVVNGEVSSVEVDGGDLGVDSSKVFSRDVVEENDNNEAFVEVICTSGA